MVINHSAASSTVSMMPHERVKALQHANNDLAPGYGAHNAAEQEAKFQEPPGQAGGDAQRAERRSAWRRSCGPRSAKTTLRAYLDQCSRAEKCRDDLCDCETVRTLRDQARLAQIEIVRYAKEHEAYKDRVAHLEQEISIAQQA
ncbi:hypothetical protein DFH07DRAFT_413595 [Mycena maculata]|uniref:Uncharacterized protein n=1 Tax=Mycena maculata TaxID=230809 RepID=A0AAD7JCC9_9AGAR|nr:hypothetical protein DFH07DRAFT_413595 [Mycena maculata]